MELERYRTEIYSCNRTRCGFCRNVCPIYNELKVETYSCRGKMILARGIIEGKLKLTKNLAEILSKCTTCGFCEYRCRLNNVKFIEAFRNDLVKLGYYDDYYVSIINNIKKYGNPYLNKVLYRYDGLSGFKSGNAKILLFGGCTYSLYYPNTLRNLARLLKNADVAFKQLGADEGCCGLLAYTCGFGEDFVEIAKSNVEKIKSRGIEEVITPCPGCYRTFSEIYKERFPELPFSVTHAIVFLCDLLDQGKIKPRNKVSLSVTYHDPCHLSRVMNITEEPRRILENIPGLKFVELEAHGYETNCCGGGGGLPITNPRLSIEIAKKRLNEVKELGVGTLVTACPTCHYMFEKVVKYLHLQVKILDIIDLLLMSTKGDENKYV